MVSVCFNGQASAFVYLRKEHKWVAYTNEKAVYNQLKDAGWECVQEEYSKTGKLKRARFRTPFPAGLSVSRCKNIKPRIQCKPGRRTDLEFFACSSD